MTATGKACPFVDGRVCLQEGCMAWLEGRCGLIRPGGDAGSAFEQKLKAAAPLMYRSLLDLVRIMEETSRDCTQMRAGAVELCPGGQGKPAGRADQLRAGRGGDKGRIKPIITIKFLKLKQLNRLGLHLSFNLKSFIYVY